jgi:hypothetical protein
LALVASVGALLAVASPAWAGVLISAVPTFPTNVTVGQTGLSASIQLANLSTSPEQSSSVTITSINLVPACGASSFVGNGDCAAANADPGVLSVSPTGVGEAGTACAGQTFSISIIDLSTGQLSVTPGVGSVVLTAPATPGAVCRIDFTVSVSKAPTKPSGTSPPNTVKTSQILFASGTAQVDGVMGMGSGSSSVTVTRAAPGITSSATATATVGTPIKDTGTLSAASPAGPTPTGTISFSLYRNDAACTTTPVFTSTVPVDSGLASYSGDANDQAATGTCGDAGEKSTVTQATPSITTTASGPVTVGGKIGDSGLLGGGFNPTGTITFKAYGPNNATCAGSPAFTSAAVAVTGNGTYSPAAMFTTTAAGTYQFVASYGGDANNSSFDSACGAANESVVVGKASPTVATTASAPGILGTAISDSATLSGGLSTPSGTITFDVYGPNDATCTGTPAFSTVIPVSGNGQYGSGPLTPTSVGTYGFVASYSGDANNGSVATACGDVHESVTVSAGSGSPPPDPTVGSVTESAKRWRAGKALPHESRARPPVGTTFSFKLNEDASVTFVFSRKVAGSKVNRRCVRRTRANRHLPSCKLLVTAGSFSFSGHSGTNRVSFAARISPAKKLRPGGYTLVITATNSAGATSPPATLRFTIVK